MLYLIVGRTEQSGGIIIFGKSEDIGWGNSKIIFTKTMRSQRKVEKAAVEFKE